MNDDDFWSFQDRLESLCQTASAPNHVDAYCREFDQRCSEAHRQHTNCLELLTAVGCDLNKDDYGLLEDRVVVRAGELSRLQDSILATTELLHTITRSKIQILDTVEPEFEALTLPTRGRFAKLAMYLLILDYLCSYWDKKLTV